MLRQAGRVRVIPINGQGPEDVVVLPDGDLVTGVADGRVLRVSPDGRRISEVADTGGRPLGIELGPDGELVVCDAERGLLAVHPDTGAVRTLADRVAGERMLVCNNAAVRADGTIYFTDSSTSFDLAHYPADLLADHGTGRLLRRDPDGEIAVLLTGLRFANGVALAPDGSWVAVAETGSYRVSRLWLSGPSAGRHEVWADQLGAFPDNLSTGADGLVWAALPEARNPALDVLRKLPNGVRRAALPVVGFVAAHPPRTSGLVGLDAAGRVARRVAVRGFRAITGVRQHGDQLYLGSLVERGIAVLDLPDRAEVTVRLR